MSNSVAMHVNSHEQCILLQSAVATVGNTDDRELCYSVEYCLTDAVSERMSVKHLRKS